VGRGSRGTFDDDVAAGWSGGTLDDDAGGKSVIFTASFSLSVFSAGFLSFSTRIFLQTDYKYSIKLLIYYSTTNRLINQSTNFFLQWPK